MRPHDLEALAKRVRRRALVGDDDLLLAPQLAARILGNDGVTFGARGSVAHLDGSRIVVPIDHPHVNAAVAYQLAVWSLEFLAQFRADRAHFERVAISLAAAIVAPPSAVRRAYAHWGERVRTIARAFGLSQGGTVLRLASVLDQERALVLPTGQTFVQSTGAFPWDSVPLVEVARGREQWRGLRKTPLRGGVDEGRVALRAV